MATRFEARARTPLEISVSTTIIILYLLGSRVKGDSGASIRLSRLAAVGGKETVSNFDAYYGPFWSFFEPSKQCGLT